MQPQQCHLLLYQLYIARISVNVFPGCFQFFNFSRIHYITPPCKTVNTMNILYVLNINILTWTVNQAEICQTGFQGEKVKTYCLDGSLNALLI